MVDETALEAERQECLKDIRDKFAVGDFEGVVEAFGRLGETQSIRGGIRIEAVGLTARAHVALGSKTRARRLLEGVGDRLLRNHRQHRFMAQAYLDLGEYRRVADLARKAAEAQETERPAAVVAAPAPPAPAAKAPAKTTRRTAAAAPVHA